MPKKHLSHNLCGTICIKSPHNCHTFCKNLPHLAAYFPKIYRTWLHNLPFRAYAVPHNLSKIPHLNVASVCYLPRSLTTLNSALPRIYQESQQRLSEKSEISLSTAPPLTKISKKINSPYEDIQALNSTLPRYPESIQRLHSEHSKSLYTRNVKSLAKGPPDIHNKMNQRIFEH